LTRALALLCLLLLACKPNYREMRRVYVRPYIRNEDCAIARDTAGNLMVWIMCSDGKGHYAWVLRPYDSTSMFLSEGVTGE
jgi:hypothetical protein